ncbi:hypothetical protein E2C01_051033 [Portunus trituberculatus]|uniref:Uncharacterized protein n=1 Tax=Portunus trituberculatus TaxID=210409 RepID=A0A5B7GAI5_PORTR|nr:hypothetical protein [Portunus trituberculatus]
MCFFHSYGHTCHRYGIILGLTGAFFLIRDGRLLPPLVQAPQPLTQAGSTGGPGPMVQWSTAGVRLNNAHFPPRLQHNAPVDVTESK